MRSDTFKSFLGEFLGTFILVFIGCGSVAVSIVFSAYSGLFQVAVVWGIGVALAIYVSRGLSCAHLNPAVSLAFVVAGRMSARTLPAYLGAQFLAAFAAAAMLYALFGGAIAGFEAAHGIVRGTPGSVLTARMYGEYLAAGAGGGLAVSMGTAFLAEGFGTFLLVLFIFALTEGCNVGRPDERAAPVFIGAAVAALICIIAPLTQAGFNPARDFGPRLFAYLAGWGSAAIPGPDNAFFLVYIAAPVAGAVTAALFFKFILSPFMGQDKVSGSDCCK
jgi:glycerol uptake facilitator protein